MIRLIQELFGQTLSATITAMKMEMFFFMVVFPFLKKEDSHTKCLFHPVFGSNPTFTGSFC